jgi:hypothetical protein
MSGWKQQLEAIGSALLLIERLPDGAVWSLTCTNDDDAESPSVLNIFAEESEWTTIITRLRLGKVFDRSTTGNEEQFITFKQGTLTISIIQEEQS